MSLTGLGMTEPLVTDFRCAVSSLIPCFFIRSLPCSQDLCQTLANEREHLNALSLVYQHLLHPAACDACWLYRAPRIGMCADSCTRWSFFAFVLLGFVQRANCRGGRTSEFGHGQSACVLLDVIIQWVTMRIHLAQCALEHVCVSANTHGYTLARACTNVHKCTQAHPTHTHTCTQSFKTPDTFFLCFIFPPSPSFFPLLSSTFNRNSRMGRCLLSIRVWL